MTDTELFDAVQRQLVEQHQALHDLEVLLKDIAARQSRSYDDLITTVPEPRPEAEEEEYDAEDDERPHDR